MKFILLFTMFLPPMIPGAPGFVGRWQMVELTSYYISAKACAVALEKALDTHQGVGRCRPVKK